VRSTVDDYYVDSTSYPPTAAMGLIPPELANMMPIGFSFVRSGYQLQYNNWTVATSLSGYPSTSTIIGITVQTDDARLGQLVLKQLANLPHFQSGNDYTFIIIGL